jgi:hypothetical protein
MPAEDATKVHVLGNNLFSILLCNVVISVDSKKQTECFKDGNDDGSNPNAFHAGRFAHCGKKTIRRDS